MYQEEKTFNVIKGVIPEFGADIQLAYAINGVKQTNGIFPVKSSDYLGVASCENGVTATWDSEAWGLMNVNSNGNKKIKCTINFIDKGAYNVVASKSLGTDVENNIDYSLKNSDSNGKGVYIFNSTKDNQYPVYFFRGNINDNHIIFGKYCWLIVRTTETGGVKLYFDGEPENGQCLINSSVINSINYNYSRIHPHDVGYYYTENELHGNSQPSLVAQEVDRWYEENLKDDYEEYLEDTVWCVNRAAYISDGNGGYIEIDSFTEEDFNEGKRMDYEAAIRLTPRSNPILDCPNANDRFTKSTTNGNGALKNPIALISAEEIVLAGAIWDSNNPNYYLAFNSYGNNIWTLTPLTAGYYSESNQGARVFSLMGGSSAIPGRLYWGSTRYYNYGVRPMISLSNNVRIRNGDGSREFPYLVESLTNE